MKERDLKIFLTFFLLGFLIYANSFNNQLFWDDDDNIVKNLYIRSWKFLPKYFTENLIAGAGLHSNYWRPLLLFSFSLDYKIWKLNPLGYHLTNTILHALNAFLIYYLLSLIFKNHKLSFFTALIFLLHPLQTEAITYVSGRGDPLSIFFILLAFIFYILVKERKQKKYLIFSYLFFTFALLTKESTIFFPALVLLYEILEREEWKTIFFKISPLLLIALLYFILRLTILNFGQTLNLYGEENIFTKNIHYRIFTFLNILLTYYSLYFFPLHLHMERTAPILTTFFNLNVIFSFFILLLILFISIYTLKKGNKIFAFGFGWFFISLFPFSNILVPISGLLYEHWMYFPLVGLSLILNYSIFEILPKLKFSKFLVPTSYFLFLLFLGFLSIRTILRNFDWKDPITFYNQTLKYSETARVHNNLAMAYADKKDFEKAIFHYQRAIEISDIYPQTHNNLGNAYKEIGQTEKAIEEFEKAIKMDPYFFFAYNNLANLYFENKEYDKAIEVYQRYLKIVPKNLSALYNLAIIYYAKKDFNNAILNLEKFLEIQPQNEEIFNLILQIKNEAKSFR
jgi:tetratricopeptide (TPR) repeat protein